MCLQYIYTVNSITIKTRTALQRLRLITFIIQSIVNLKVVILKGKDPN